jgi:hypothetical protein
LAAHGPTLLLPRFTDLVTELPMRAGRTDDMAV